jgi:hypothetical protein
MLVVKSGELCTILNANKIIITQLVASAQLTVLMNLELIQELVAQKNHMVEELELCWIVQQIKKKMLVFVISLVVLLIEVLVQFVGVSVLKEPKHVELFV